MPHESFEHFICGSDGERDSLPEETWALYDQLLADGAMWRAEQPAPTRLDDEIAVLVSAHAPSRAHGNVRDTRHDQASRPIHHTPRYSKGAISMSSSRIRSVIAGGAAAVVVALLAFLLVNAATSRNMRSPASNATGTSNPTLSSAPHINVPAGRWVPQPKLNDTTDVGATGVLAVAPSDPRVVYEALNIPGKNGSYNASLRRTDDSGSSWHPLPLTVPASDVNYVNMFVSPIDAHVVWLQLSDQAATACPTGESGMGDVSGGTTHGGILASGFGFCGLEWYSSDAGQHWTSVKLSVPGLLSGTGLNTPSLIAQGSRLYTTSGCVSRDCTRLLTSTDNGATWHIADSGMLTSKNTLCDFAPAPAGSTLYAVTSAGDCTWLDTSPHILWHSDDSGAHWMQVNTLPGQTERGLQVAQTVGTTQSILYADMPTKTGSSTDKVGEAVPVWTDAATDLKYSLDGGKTWHAAPAAGAPTALKPYWAPSAVLGDGSVVWQFSKYGNDDPTGASLYAWKPGDSSWRLLAPAVPTGFIDGLTVISSSGHGDQLWAVTRDIPTTSAPVTYRVMVFQL